MPDGYVSRKGREESPNTRLVARQAVLRFGGVESR